MRALLKELGEMGKTVLMSSHVLTDMVDVCDRFLVLEQGQVVFHGTLPELRSRVVGNRLLRVAAADLDTLHEYVERQSWVTRVSRVDSEGTATELRLVLSPDAPALDKLSQELFQAGHALHLFAEESFDLEEAFLRLTKGEIR